MGLTVSWSPSSACACMPRLFYGPGCFTVSTCCTYIDLDSRGYFGVNVALVLFYFIFSNVVCYEHAIFVPNLSNAVDIWSEQWILVLQHWGIGSHSAFPTVYGLRKCGRKIALHKLFSSNADIDEHCWLISTDSLMSNSWYFSVPFPIAISTCQTSGNEEN